MAYLYLFLLLLLLLLLIIIIIIIIIIINRFVLRHKVVTSESLRPGSVLVSRERRESLREEECLKSKLKNCNRVTTENSLR